MPSTAFNCCLYLIRVRHRSNLAPLPGNSGSNQKFITVFLCVVFIVSVCRLFAVGSFLFVFCSVFFQFSICVLVFGCVRV